MIKEMLNDDKPRERFMKYGVNNLSNEELVSIIIRCGTKNISVKDLSRNILSKIDNINELNELSINSLLKLKGMGVVKAITLLSSIELGKRVIENNKKIKIRLNNSNQVFEYFNSIISVYKQEVLIAVFLDIKKNLLGYEVIFKGTVSQSITSPREIFNKAVYYMAAGFIIIHNHPSGDVKPSSFDKEFTNNLIKSGVIMQIYLIDHIIIGNNNYYSFKDDGDL